MFIETRSTRKVTGTGSLRCSLLLRASMRHGFLLAINRLDSSPPQAVDYEPTSIPSLTAEELCFQLFVNRLVAEPNLEIRGREVRSFNADSGVAVQLQVGT